MIQAIQSQAPRRIALDIISGAFVTEPTLISDALWFWLKMHVDVVDEFEELLISPITMIREIERRGRTAGDCDDVTMLAASILASCGAEVQLMATWPDDDGSFQHVLCRYRFPKMENFVDFDATVYQDQIDYPPEVLTVDIVS